MSPSRWVQIVCSLILVLLPAAIHYRNWKYADKRTKVHRWVTKVLLALWVLAGAGVTWATWKGFSRKERSPSFGLYLNGLRLSRDCQIALPSTNGIQQMSFTVLNDGNLPADGLSVEVCF